jgi:hypothetical protein
VQNLQNFERHKSNYVRTQIKNTLHLEILVNSQLTHVPYSPPHGMYLVQNTVISPISCVTVPAQDVQITNGQITSKTEGVINRNRGLSTTFQSSGPVQNCCIIWKPSGRCEWTRLAKRKAIIR